MKRPSVRVRSGCLLVRSNQVGLSVSQVESRQVISRSGQNEVNLVQNEG